MECISTPNQLCRNANWLQVIWTQVGSDKLISFRDKVFHACYSRPNIRACVYTNFPPVSQKLLQHHERERLRTTGYLLPIQIDPFICSVKLILLVFCFGKPVGVSGSTAGCIIFLNGSKIFGSKFPCIKVTCFMRYPLNTQKCSQRKYLTSFLISNQNLTFRPFGIEPLNNTTRALIWNYNRVKSSPV